MRAVIYAAKSTADVHDSLPGQIKDCEALASREGLEVSESWTDEAESAYTGDRGPGLQSAMEACERLAPCALIVQHTSRLARGNVRESRHLIEIAIWAIKHDVEIKSKENPLPQDNLLLLAAVAGDQDHAYSKRLGTSVSGGLTRSFQRGNWPGRPSDGYVVKVERDSGGRTVRRWLEKDPEMEPTIRRLLDLGVDQMLPPASIARALNADGMPNGRGNEWRARDVKRALTNPMYAGILRYKGEERRDGCPKYVSVEQHERLVQHYDTKPQTRKGRRSEGYLLRGLAVCGRCGERMYCHTRRDYGPEPRRFYRCGRFLKPSDRTCGVRVDADEVDREVLEWLDVLISDFDDWREQVLDAASSERERAQRELDQALEEIDRADTRATRAERDYMKALDSDDDDRSERFGKMFEKVSRDRTAAMERAEHRRAALAALDAQAVSERMGETVRRLSQRDTEAINDALRVEFERFVIDPDTGDMTPEWKPPEAEFDLGALLERYQASCHGDTEPC